MKEKVGKILIISVVVLVILVVMFYWFAWRPSKIRKECMENAQQVRGISNLGKQVSQESIDRTYFNCLRERGLEK